MATTYSEIVYRAAVSAHKSQPDIPVDRYRVTAETIFPSVVEEVVLSVATNLAHPWRSQIEDVTTALADGDLIPTTGSLGDKIVGEYGIVKDADDGKPLVNSFSLAEIRAINADTWKKLPVYAFQIVKPRIYHTRTTVTIDVCVYDPTDVTTAIAADQVPIFPDAAYAYVDALVAKLLDPSTMFKGDLQRELAGVKA